MEKCDCYHVRTRSRTIFDGAFLIAERYGVCYGTKECDECSCGGDSAKCDFYPEKREKCTFDEQKENEFLNTVEMWLAAQADNGYYACVNGDIAYSKSTGLVRKTDGTTWWLSNLDHKGKNALDCLLSQDQWVKREVMSIAEAEEKFGIKIKEN